MKNSKKKKRFLAIVREIDRENARLRRTLTKYGYRSMVEPMKPNAREVYHVTDVLMTLRDINEWLPFVLTYSQDLTRDPRNLDDDDLPF